MEELGKDGFLPRSFTTPPDQQAAPVTEPVTPQASAQPAEPTAQTPAAEPQQPAPAGVEPKGDEFFENFNKRYGTQYKSDEELKGILGAPQKVVEYEGQLKDYNDLKKREADYLKQIEEIKNAGNTEFLSKPLVRKAYVADQLLSKYPDKDPFVLQEIAMADVNKLADLDVLVKKEKIDLPTASEKDIKDAILDELGIDPEMKPEEWSSIAKTKIAMRAKSARAEIKSLTSGIQLPQAVTKEERERIESENLQKRTSQMAPLKEKFSQYDKFKDGEFEFDVPAEYKARLGDMFQAMFVDAGQEPNEENYQAIVELRDALFLKQNFQKIKEVIAKQAQTEIQKKLDDMLDNKTKPNTSTATDNTTSKEEPLPGKSVTEAFQKYF